MEEGPGAAQQEDRIQPTKGEKSKMEGVEEDGAARNGDHNNDGEEEEEGTRTIVSSSLGGVIAVADDDDDDDDAEEERDDADSEPPILVGYVFAAKKMNTMGLIMAEASRQVSFWAVDDHRLNDDEDDDYTKGVPVRATTTTDSSRRLTAAALRLQELECNEAMDSSCDGEDDARKPKSRMLSPSQPPRNSFYSFAYWLRRRCSLSAASSSAMETTVSSSYPHSCAPRGTPATATTRRGSGSATSSHSLPLWAAPPRQLPQRRRRLVRVSFVPLDLNMALEEQHGGNFDVILHKLTEDILYVSQHPETDEESSEPQQRVKRLLSYRSQCSLVDDPLKVQMVMSRFAISQVLSRCLQQFASPAVRAPSFRVLRQKQGLENVGNELKFPVMVKSLEAAGTAHSHDMAVVVRPQGLAPALERLQVGDCLVQDYVNHNSRLFKVYVLGDVVKVFLRPSLPNLPPLTTNTRQCHNETGPSFVQFDSQKRPYPTLNDFGLREENSADDDDCHHRDITEEEIRPVAAAIRQAFGLDLFGFDVLVSPDHVMWVVDVNYFPSYKEVTNFPSLLAHYLTCRALQNRYASST